MSFQYLSKKKNYYLILLENQISRTQKNMNAHHNSYDLWSYDSTRPTSTFFSTSTATGQSHCEAEVSTNISIKRPIGHHLWCSMGLIGGTHKDQRSYPMPNPYSWRVTQGHPFFTVLGPFQAQTFHLLLMFCIN